MSAVELAVVADVVEPAGPGRRRRRRRVRVGLGVGVAVVVVGAAAAAAYGFGGGDPSTPAAGHLPPATAKVTRTTLTQTEKVSGTLGFGDTTVVTARSSAAGRSGASGGTASATLTWLAPEGATVTRGKPLYKVDDQPVVLLYGATPPYRVLRSGLTGADVTELEDNLKALGYTGFTADDTYTSATASAVKQWQEDLGLTETGTVDVNQVVLAPGELRVAKHKADVGAPASGPVLTYTGTTRVVTVALDVADQQLVRTGLAATVTLPDDSTVPGVLSTVGTVATKTVTGSGPSQTSTTTIDVTVTIADQAKLGTLDEAPVDVTLVSDRRENVLAVPVGALVALHEGGYGVLVVDGTGTRYMPVTTGMFADGKVEVSGDGIAEGMTVGVPK
jgi:peptidoglycan hydrolase-like protein with peptidoglycan-binding domain